MSVKLPEHSPNGALDELSEGLLGNVIILDIGKHFGECAEFSDDFLGQFGGFGCVSVVLLGCEHEQEDVNEHDE